MAIPSFKPCFNTFGKILGFRFGYLKKLKDSLYLITIRGSARHVLEQAIASADVSVNHQPVLDLPQCSAKEIQSHSILRWLTKNFWQEPYRGKINFKKLVYSHPFPQTKSGTPCPSVHDKLRRWGERPAENGKEKKERRNLCFFPVFQEIIDPLKGQVHGSMYAH